MNNDKTRSYSSVGNMGLEGRPAEIIEALLGELASSCSAAAAAAASGDAQRRIALTSKAMGIISDGLLPCLDMEKGGAIAANLESIYDYSTRRLVLANKNSDPEGYAECSMLAQQILNAWKTVVSGRVVPGDAK